MLADLSEFIYFHLSLDQHVFFLVLHSRLRIIPSTIRFLSYHHHTHISNTTFLDTRQFSKTTEFAQSRKEKRRDIFHQ